jgi:Subtilase family
VGHQGHEVILILFCALAALFSSEMQIILALILLSYFNFFTSDYSTNASVAAELSIESYSGPLPTYMKLVVFEQVTSFEFDTKLSTSYGHPNAAQGAVVGAARYSSTPAFGISPPILESFSSAGGTPILFTKTGARLSSPEIRNQPQFTGPNGGATTFFGVFSGGFYRFFWTSAAAPHVAAVVALMSQYKGGNRSLTPTQIYATLANTAIDMDDPSTVGFDVGLALARIGAGECFGRVQPTIKLASRAHSQCSCPSLCAAYNYRYQ